MHSQTPPPQPRARRLEPGRALTHPAWWIALAVLALNDHVLKGAAVLPGWATGKLSDLAGLFLAPVLLAALVRARTSRQLAAAHVATGAVFALLQLSPDAARLWDHGMTLLGVPWRTWSDPTDLLALPILAVAWWFWRAKTAQQGSWRPWQRALKAGGVGLGLACCVATSAIQGPYCDGDYTRDGACRPYCPSGTSRDSAGVCRTILQTSVYLHNATSQTVQARVRTLRADLMVDCDAVREDPGALLRRAAFGPGQTLAMPPGTNAALAPSVTSGCGVAWLEGQTIAPTLVVWDPAQLPQQTLYASETVAADLPPGGINLARDASDPDLLEVTRIGDVAPTLHKPNTQRAEPPPAPCAPPPALERVDWSLPIEPSVFYRVTDVAAHPDGCTGVTLDPGADPLLRPVRGYICAPTEALDLVAGDGLKIDPSPDRVTLTRTPDPDAPGARPWTLHLGRSSAGAIAELGLSATLAPIASCSTALDDDACALAERAAQLDILDGAEARALRAGDTTTYTRADGTTRTLWVVRAAQRVVWAPSCMPPAHAQTTTDLEWVVLDQPLQPEEGD